MKAEPDTNALEELMEQIDDMSPHELASIIAGAGIDLADARRKLYQRVTDEQARLTESGTPVPASITNFLSQMKPDGAAAARKNGQKGGWPKGKRRKGKRSG